MSDNDPGTSDLLSHSGDPLRHRWAAGAHEQRVERFYSHGATRYGDYHGGYLNFGLWDAGVASYEQAARNMVVRLAEWGGVGPQAVLLDVACGLGAQDTLIFAQFQPRELVGIDVTWSHVQAACERARQAHLPASVRFEHGSATNLPFPEQRFSHVLCIEGAVHFDTRERFLREAFRVLRRGGILVLADYALRAPSRTLAQRALLEGVARGWCVPADNHDTALSYRAKLERTGFERVELRSVGALTYPHYYREQRGFAHLWRLRAIRGTLATLGGLCLDWGAFQAWRRGIIDYVLVRAEKPAMPS